MFAKSLIRTAAILIALLLSSSTVLAQDAPPISDIEVTFLFGEQVTVSGRIDPALDYDAIDIHLSFAGDPRTLTAPITPAADGTFSYVHLVADRFIPAFSEVSYAFAITSGGEVETTAPDEFFYTDNRFDWFLLESAAINIHWYEGDTAYATRVLDAARDGLNRSRSLLEIELPQKIDIYAYAGLEDYLFARGQLGQRWAGGHADPSTGLVLVSLPPSDEAQLEIERKIPHEVAHILLFEATGAGFWNLPTWLNEGFASMLETFPNADYSFLAAQAAADDRQIALADLCETFPGDASGALLAYAESTLFVTYLTDVYGPAGLRAVIDSYAAGAGCTQGTLAAPVSMELDTAQAAWQSSIRTTGSGPDVLDGSATVDPFPVLIVLFVVIGAPGLVLVGFGFQRRRAHGH